MAELQDIINEVPESITNPGSEEDEEIKDDTEEESEEETEDESSEEESEDEESEDEEEDEEDEDYEEEVPTTPIAPVAAPTGTEASSEAQFILQGLVKIPVRIIAADDSVQTVEVYGKGDLPRDFKGFATPYEGEVFSAQVTAQEIKARDLATQYQNQQTQKQTQEYEVKENAAIAEDLRDLRADGLFPKFKGNPGTREFDNSDGAKEFDRVIAFMNERNAEYGRRAQSGKSYRHIGFRESFEILNGPNIKANEQKEDKARKNAARKTVSGKGTKATTERRAPRQVTNLTDLADEFQPTGA